MPPQIAVPEAPRRTGAPVVAMDRSSAERLTLTVLTEQGVRAVGSFRSAAAAWEALDQLGAPLPDEPAPTTSAKCS